MSDASPRPEAVAAAEWWADQLRSVPDHNTGEPLSTAFIDMAAHSRQQVFTTEQIRSFQSALAEEIEEDLNANSDGWRPNEPGWGSAMRGVHNDYGPDPLLKSAAERAGIKLTVFDVPIKTDMWINPGQVRVATGHGAGIVTVWGEGA